MNQIIVEEDDPKFLISSLSPAAGRNYSIAIQAVSNGVESEEIVIYQVTSTLNTELTNDLCIECNVVSELLLFSGPSSPIVLDLRAIEQGIFISWKSDVTSRQDTYLIQYTRNDTSEPFNQTTGDGQLTILDNIFPGAAYNIQLFAISHDLFSEKHTYFQAVCKFQHPLGAIRSSGQPEINCGISLQFLIRRGT